MDLVEVKTLIRSALIADANITSIVELRVYPAELALIEDPQFPCIAFKIGGGIAPAVALIDKLTFLDMTIWAYASTSGGLTQALQLHTLIQNVLHQTRHSSAILNIVTQNSGGPAEAFDPTARVNYLTSPWRIFSVQR